MASITKQQLQLQSRETPEQYNIRIANLRGDSPTSLANIQQLTSQAIAGLPKTITGDGIAPTVPTPFTAPTPTPTDDVTGLGDTVGLTEPEKKAQAQIERLQGLIEDSEGESAFRAQEEAGAGITGLTATQTDLQAQLNNLVRQAKGISTGLTTRGAKESGVSTVGITTLQRGELRENAIAALSISSMLEASRGNLSLALDLVDRAVAEEFDPIKEQINAAKANLELLIASPEFTVAESNRAAELRASLDAQSRAIEAQEEERKDIRNFANDVSRQGADAVTLRNIQNASSIEEAQQIAASAGVFAEDETSKTPRTQIAEVGGNKVLIDLNTGDIIKDFGSADAGDGEPDPDDFSSSQFQAATFAKRIEQSEEVLSGGRGLFIPFLPQFLKSGDRERFEQATENFINALLRRESGAAIADSEFASARKQYIPRKTDTQATLEQKARNRRIVLEGLSAEGSGAFDILTERLGDGELNQEDLDEVDSLLLEFNPADFFNPLGL